MPWALPAPLLPAMRPHTSASLALGTEQRGEGIKEESSREQVAGRKQQQKTQLICPHPPLQQELTPLGITPLLNLF